MEFIELTAAMRTKTGNGPARVLRRSGHIPAVLYGPGTEPAMLSLPAYDLEMALKNKTGPQLMLDLRIGDAGTPPRKAMLKELQRHPVSHEFIHADLYEFAMDRKIRVRVPVTTVGKCIGVEMGGMLQIIRRELEVLCLPTDIPRVVEVDITNVNVGEAVHIKDIRMDKLEFPHEVNFTVLTVLGKKDKETGEGGEAAAEEAAA